MNGIYLTSDKNEIIEYLKKYSLSRNVYKELKEPILYDENDILIYSKKGFAVVNKDLLKYLYILEDFRNKGHGSLILSFIKLNLNLKTIIATIPIARENFYIKNEFKVKRRLVNYLKVEYVRIS